MLILEWAYYIGETVNRAFGISPPLHTTGIITIPIHRVVVGLIQIMHIRCLTK